MKYFILVFLLVISLPAVSGDSVQAVVEQKRAEAEAKRMKMMQEIQHRKANPEAFLSNNENSSSSQSQQITFPSGDNGHFYIPASLNGRSIDFIADTGATDIFLTQEDAKTAGISTYALNYNLTYNTANGQVQAAETNVKSLNVGPIRLNNVKVAVSKNSGGTSLLGMTFFNQLSKYEVVEGNLTLYK